jgi:hypothetical protein
VRQNQRGSPCPNPLLLLPSPIPFFSTGPPPLTPCSANRRPLTASPPSPPSFIWPRWLAPQPSRPLAPLPQSLLPKTLGFQVTRGIQYLPAFRRPRRTRTEMEGRWRWRISSIASFRRDLATELVLPQQSVGEAEVWGASEEKCSAPVWPAGRQPAAQD